eukprot:5250780-Pyramimonas_sp.AAC.1
MEVRSDIACAEDFQEQIVHTTFVISRVTHACRRSFPSSSRDHLSGSGYGADVRDLHEKVGAGDVRDHARGGGCGVCERQSGSGCRGCG